MSELSQVFRKLRSGSTKSAEPILITIREKLFIFRFKGGSIREKHVGDRIYCIKLAVHELHYSYILKGTLLQD